TIRCVHGPSCKMMDGSTLTLTEATGGAGQADQPRGGSLLGPAADRHRGRHTKRPAAEVPRPGRRPLRSCPEGQSPALDCIPAEMESITEESANVVTSPTGRFSATSRSRRRMIFPARVL